MLGTINQRFTQWVSHPDFGLLLLRLTFGILMLFHGVAKLQHGIGWIETLLQSYGIPGFVASGVWVGEIIAPILIIIGVFTRPAALIYAITLLVATLLVGTGKIFTLTEVGAWGLEIEAIYFLGGLCIMFLGSGKYTLARVKSFA